MKWTRSVSLAILGLSSMAFVGCGHSEDEWQAKLRENQTLIDQMNADKAAAKSLQDQIEQLRQQLKQAGSSMADKDSALAKLQRDKAQLDQIRQRFELLKQKLESLTKLGLSVTVRKNRMTIQLPGDVLFDSGKTDLKKEGKDILLKVAEVIRADPQLNSRSFQVAGHTDNKPLGAANPYRDNWGLSVMRAREVLSFLITPPDDKKGGGGLTADHWSAAGYGDTDPIAANEGPENMQKNRRVELVVLPNVEEMLDLKSLTN